MTWNLASLFLAWVSHFSTNLHWTDAKPNARLAFLLLLSATSTFAFREKDFDSCEVHTRTISCSQTCSRHEHIISTIYGMSVLQCVSLIVSGFESVLLHFLLFVIVARSTDVISTFAHIKREDSSSHNLLQKISRDISLTCSGNDVGVWYGSSCYPNKTYSFHTPTSAEHSTIKTPSKKAIARPWSPHRVRLETRLSTMAISCREIGGSCSR